MHGRAGISGRWYKVPRESERLMLTMEQMQSALPRPLLKQRGRIRPRADCQVRTRMPGQQHHSDYVFLIVFSRTEQLPETD